MSRLVLIDGNAILHRAYHALPKLTNKKGELTNAVYGFASMIIRIINDLKPSHIVVTFDRPAPTFRKKLYKEYQGKRPKMEDDLSSQVERVHQLVKELGIPIYEMDGYEADDLIGTLAFQANKQHITHNPQQVKTVIVTGDRDILQLVNETTKVYMPVKGLSEAKLYGIEEVKEKYDLIPSQIVDLKALTGDSSDNYPGVSGIGPKTAIDLLKKYQNVENIYKEVDKQSSDISPRVLSNLKAGRNDADMCYKLATIVKSAPVKLDLEQARLHGNSQKLEKVLLEFGFESLARRVANNPPSPRLRRASKKQGQIKKKEKQLGLF